MDTTLRENLIDGFTSSAKNKGLTANAGRLLDEKISNINSLNLWIPKDAKATKAAIVAAYPTPAKNYAAMALDDGYIYVNDGLGALAANWVNSGQKQFPVDVTTYNSLNEGISAVKFSNGNARLVSAYSLYPNATWAVEMYISLTNVNTLQNIMENGIGYPSFFITNGKIMVSKAGVANAGYFYITDYINTKVHIIISFNGTSHSVFINGVEVSFIVDELVTYSSGISTLNIGSYAGTSQYFLSDIFYIRIFNIEKTHSDALVLYNRGLPSRYSVQKNGMLMLEINAGNSYRSNWFDSSSYNQVLILSGGYTLNSNAVFTSNTSDILSVVPKNIYIAVGVEFNLWYSSILPYNKYDLRLDCVCSVGKSMERSYRYTPTTTGTASLTLNIRNSENLIIETKTITLNVVSKTAGSGVKQILPIGDSTTDSYLTDYLGTGRQKYEMLLELNSKIITDGGITPLFLGNNGISPIKHEGHSGYSTDMFLVSGGAYPNPFWDSSLSRNNLKKWMLNNSFFGGSDRIDYVFIQLGINDLKDGGNPSDVIARYTTIINNILDPTYGYPSAKIILSMTPYTAENKDGWALHFNATSSYEVYVSNMLKLMKLIVTTFENNVSFPNVFLSPNFLFVDRKFGYPRQLINISSRVTDQEYQYTDSVHPDTSGYKQCADSYYSRLRALL